MDNGNTKDIFNGEKTGKLYFGSYDIKTLLMYHEMLFPKKNLDDWLDEETD